MDPSLKTKSTEDHIEQMVLHVTNVSKTAQASSSKATASSSMTFAASPHATGAPSSKTAQASTSKATAPSSKATASSSMTFAASPHATGAPSSKTAQALSSKATAPSSKSTASSSMTAHASSSMTAHAPSSMTAHAPSPHVTDAPSSKAAQASSSNATYARSSQVPHTPLTHSTEDGAAVPEASSANDKSDEYILNYLKFLKLRIDEARPPVAHEDPSESVKLLNRKFFLEIQNIFRSTAVSRSNLKSEMAARERNLSVSSNRRIEFVVEKWAMEMDKISKESQQ